MNEYKAFIIPLLFLLFFSLVMPEFVGNYSKMSDYSKIWNCAEGINVDNVNNDNFNCDYYPPVLIWIAKLFGSRQIFFKQFLLTCFTLILPLILFKITNNWITTWFYFSTTNFYFAIMTSSFFAQGLSMILIFSMMFLKNWQRVLILLILILTHSYAFVLGAIFFFLIVLQESKLLEPFYKKTILFCSPIWGNVIPPELNQRLITIPNSSTTGFTTVNTLLSVFIKRTPLPFLLMSIKGLIDKKQLALLGFMVISFIYGFLYHERAFYFMALPMIIGLTYYYEDASIKMRHFIIVLSVLMLIFNLWQFFVILQC